MKDDERREAEAFLDLVPRSQKGKLKVFLGGAAGVGKTYRMLQEAHHLRQQGRDVVLGVIETHGRAETAAQLGDLEAIPLRAIEYRGTVLHELDVDAIVARNPEIVVVDELAHTNAPGSRHEKRYQDVEDLLEKGISVITALNIQHLEGLKPLIKRITGIEVKETLPDTFLLRADQLVTVDIAIEELRQRLREGKIYPPEQVEQALKNFFKPSNIAALRELALREVARDQSRQREELEQVKRDGGRRSAVTERIMVCLSSNSTGGGELLRKAARTAAQLNADWFAVHVETPSESVQKISTADFRTLLDNINMAADLGAEIVQLKAPDVVKALLDFAREKAITRIMTGRTTPTLWNRIRGRSITSKLIDAARDFDVEVVARAATDDQ
jgi:two-component system sensor histidine kinase KdpD